MFFSKNLKTLLPTVSSTCF